MKRFIGLLLLVLLVGWSPDPARAQETPAPKGILIIPSIDLVKFIQTAPVIQVDGLRVHDVAWLGDGVAWLDDTGWIDTPRWRMALAGHNPGAFSRLGELQVGDSIYLITSTGLVRYVAAEVYVVDAVETWVLDSTGEPSLVLITCSGAQRLAVVAWRAGTGRHELP